MATRETTPSSQAPASPAAVKGAMAANEGRYAPQNAMRDVVATINSAAKEAYLSNAMPAANKHISCDRDVEKALAAIANENPVHKKLTTRIKDDVASLQVVHTVLKKLFSGAKLMHLPPEVIHGIVNDVYAHVAEYQAHKEQNPTLDIGYLVMKIGPGSHFFQSRHQMIVECHPEHENYLENNSTKSGEAHPSHHATAKHPTHSHSGKIEKPPQSEPAYGYPTGRDAIAAAPASIAVMSPEHHHHEHMHRTARAHVENVTDSHLGTPGTVVENVTHHGIMEAILHFAGLR
jgi:hypothetical protein